jgi:hypothetical protein
MDAVTIIIAVILISAFVLPVALSGREYRKKKKRFLMDLSLLMEQQNLRLTHYDICGSFIIGMDESSNILAFYKKEKSKEIFRLIKFSEISECKIIVVSRDISTKSKHYNAIDRIELSLFPVDKGKPPILLEIYNSEYDSLTLTGELQVAEKWKQIINSKIGKQVKIKPVKKEPVGHDRARHI